MKKLTRYRLPIARTFPAYHPRKGEETGFWQMIQNSIHRWPYDPHKIHTIRKNYHLWKERFYKIDTGEACLELYEWTGKPYKSKQKTLCQLTREHGIGLQEMHIQGTIYNGELTCVGVINRKEIYPAKNDGLSESDCANWFGVKPQEQAGRFALIHFTKFRY